MRNYPNLVKEVVVNRPEQVWVADITHLQVKKKHYYLHLITDAYSKRIVGFQLVNNMLAVTKLKALENAVSEREYKEQLIHHLAEAYNIVVLFTLRNYQIAILK